MKTFKILLISFLAITLMSASCSADEVEGDTGCDCVEVREESSDYPNYDVWHQTDYVFPTLYGCSQNNLLIDKSSSNYISQGVQVLVRHRVVCQ